MNSRLVVIVRVRMVSRKTVVGDRHFDSLSGSHLQSLRDYSNPDDLKQPTDDDDGGGGGIVVMKLLLMMMIMTMLLLLIVVVMD